MVKRLKRLKIPCLVVVLTTVLMLCLGTVCSSADEEAVAFPIEFETNLYLNEEEGEFGVTQWYSMPEGEYLPLYELDTSKNYIIYFNGIPVTFACSPFVQENNFLKVCQLSPIGVYDGYNGNVIHLELHSDVEAGMVGISFDIWGVTMEYEYGDSFVLSSYSVELPESSPLEDIFGLFRAVGNWLATSLGSMLSIFYVDGKLTLLGVLAVVPLAFSVVFLLISILQRFLKFGG